jgi:hypothetical protein
MKKSLKMIAAAIVASISLWVSAVAGENSQKLSGSQIRAKFSGMQLTDEVHWRYVYDHDGSLRSYSMGTKSWQMGSREGRALSLSRGTGRWLFRSIALGQTHRDEAFRIGIDP